MLSYTYVLENIAVLYPAAYVGKSNDPVRRLIDHEKEVGDTRPRYLRSHLTNAMRKYGPKNFILHVVEECDSEAKAFEKEREWIAYLRQMGVYLYNKTPGGYGGEKRATSEETRRKQSETHKRRQQSLELRQRTSKKLTGHIKSNETCLKISLVKRKSVLQLDLNNNVIAEFASAIEAEETGACRSKICECCKGRRSKAGGFRWRYK